MKPVVLVTRKLPERVEERLRRDYTPILNPDDAPCSPAGSRATASPETLCRCRWPRTGKRVKLARSSIAYQSEAAMSHAQMLKIRRTKQRTRKLLAGTAKRAKKLRGLAVKTVVDAAKKAST